MLLQLRKLKEIATSMTIHLISSEEKRIHHRYLLLLKDQVQTTLGSSAERETEGRRSQRLFSLTHHYVWDQRKSNTS